MSFYFSSDSFYFNIIYAHTFIKGYRQEWQNSFKKTRPITHPYEFCNKINPPTQFE